VSGTPFDLTQRYWPGTVVVVEAENAEPLRAAATAHRAVRSVEDVTEPNRLRLHLEGPEHVADVVADLVSAGVRVTRVEPLSPTLEDLYFAVRTKKVIADDGGRQLSPDAAPVTDRHRQVSALTGWPGATPAREDRS
jgi:hypothetical protein